MKDSYASVDAVVTIKEQKVKHTRAGTKTFKIDHEISVREVCETMKFNVESTDPGTKNMLEIGNLVSGNLLLLTMAIACCFCGQEFLKVWLSVLCVKTARAKVRQTISTVSDLQSSVITRVANGYRLIIQTGCVNQPTNQAANQPTNQPTNPSTNQPTRQPTS